MTSSVIVFLLCLVLTVLGESLVARQVRGGIEAVRLMNGTLEFEGRVEVMSQGVWGSVCNDEFNRNAARVVCRSLGYPGRNLGLERILEYSPAAPNVPILLDEVRCLGNESSLNECQHDPIGTHDCGHGEDIGVLCDGYENITDIRLVGGSSPQAGRLEILFRNVWGTVCDDSFTLTDAGVACKMLGSGNMTAMAFENSYFGVGHGQIWMDDVNCDGDADSLAECQHSGWGNNNCQHNEDVAIACGNVTIDSVRLADGNSTYGRAEILIFGIWGTICDDGFNDKGATVFCRMMGRNSGVFDVTRISGGSRRIWLSNIVCNGEETNLNDCREQTPHHECVHNEDVWIRCD